MVVEEEEEVDILVDREEEGEAAAVVVVDEAVDIVGIDVVYSRKQSSKARSNLTSLDHFHTFTMMYWPYILQRRQR